MNGLLSRRRLSVLPASVPTNAEPTLAKQPDDPWRPVERDKHDGHPAVPLLVDVRDGLDP